jgi:EF hand domain-containing protein
MPSISPSGAAAEAIAEYDTNHDGVISGAELDKCPALKRSLSRYDTNGDGKITADHIAAHIAMWQETNTALTQLGLLITLDGKPLAGATVTAEPEKFLGPAMLPASGMTGSDGGTMMRISKDKPGIQHGLYKVRISKVVNGKEVVPARYNTETELGIEVAQDVPELASGGMPLQLKSK